jgi:hypothetical protein
MYWLRDMPSRAARVQRRGNLIRHTLDQHVRHALPPPYTVTRDVRAVPGSWHGLPDRRGSSQVTPAARPSWLR